MGLVVGIHHRMHDRRKGERELKRESERARKKQE